MPDKRAPTPGNTTPDEPTANATDKGRFGSARPDQPHLSPEIPPTRGGPHDDTKPPTKALPGALPENQGIEEEARRDEG